MTESEQKEIFAKNLNKYIRMSGKEQRVVAIELGIAPTTFNTWCMGKIVPSAPKLRQIADYFNIGVSFLLDEAPDPRTAGLYNRPRVIPVLGRVAAGVPIEMIEDIVDEIEIPGHWDGEHFGLLIHGDSMEPKISDGDIVIVRKQDYIDNGQIGIITINGEDATCKRIYKYAESLVLMSTNPKYPPMEYSIQDAETLPIRILGKVVELRAKF